MRANERAVAGSALMLVLMICPMACKREERGFRVAPAAAMTVDAITTTSFHVGPTTQPAHHIINGYEENAYAMSQGKLLFSDFNCVGCHFHGGGGIGPALMDDKWIYGSQPDQIFASILQGRPNGMPSFRGKIPNNQVWQLVAYVRSLSGLVNHQAAPGRDDSMHMTTPENSVPRQAPIQSDIPKSGVSAS